jgi:hypothetical protein
VQLEVRLDISLLLLLLLLLLPNSFYSLQLA